MTLLCTPTTRPNHSCRDCRPWPGVAQRSAGYPGSDPPERFIPVGNASGDLASTRLLKTTVHRARTSPTGPRFGPHVTRHPAQVPRPGLCNPYRIEFCLGSVTRGSHVPWQPRAMVSKSFRLAPAPGSLPLGQAQFRLPLGRDERLPKSPHDPRLLTCQSTSRCCESVWVGHSLRVSPSRKRPISFSFIRTRHDLSSPISLWIAQIGRWGNRRLALTDLHQKLHRVDDAQIGKP